MRKGGGKQKGAAFERDICRKLSLWVTAGKRSDIFWRSAMSGGRATVAKARGEDMAHVSGDVCAVHEAGHVFVDALFIEIKFYKDLRLSNVLVGRPSKLIDFWHKACAQAAEHNKYPVLIAKQNGLPTLCCSDINGMAWLAKDVKVPTVRIPHLSLHIVLLDDLLKTKWKTFVLLNDLMKTR